MWLWARERLQACYDPALVCQDRSGFCALACACVASRQRTLSPRHVVGMAAAHAAVLRFWRVWCVRDSLLGSLLLMSSLCQEVAWLCPHNAQTPFQLQTCPHDCCVVTHSSAGENRCEKTLLPLVASQGGWHVCALPWGLVVVCVVWGHGCM